MSDKEQDQKQATGREASDLTHLLCAVAEQLEEAAESIADWGAYASPYFQEKHDLNGDISRFKTYAALIRKQTGI